MVEIRHIDDVLPVVEGRKDFVVIDKGSYRVIDYVYADRDSFDHPLRLECRGIKFAPGGKIIARPFHKFFNVGEREQLHEIDFGQPHYVFEKLDGSMVHPARVEGDMRLMTRKGVTDVSEKAERFFKEPGYAYFMRECLDAGYTPIFEYTAPDNRIVIRHEEPELTLLAVREIVSGYYLNNGAARSWAHGYRVPFVTDVGRVDDDAQGFVDRVRALQDSEGVVICFLNGHRVKLKADEYVKKHRALDGLQSKKSALVLALDGLVDDVVPMLDPADADELREFEYQVIEEVNGMTERAQNVALKHGHKPRKDFALDHASTLPVAERSLAFIALDGKDTFAAAVNLVRRNPDLVKAKWRGE